MKKRIKISQSFIPILALFFFIIYIIPEKTNTIKTDGKDEYILNPHSLRHDKETLNIAIEYSENPLNPFYDSGREISIISKLINPSLVKKDKKNVVEMDIAKEYWYEDNGSAIAVVLRDDIYFSDGKKLTTKDVERTFLILADPDYSGPHSDYVSNIKGYYEYKKNRFRDAFGIEVINDTFMKFHFDIVDLNNVNTLVFPIVNPGEQSEIVKNIKNLDKMKFVDGAGRYKVVDQGHKGIELVLKNKNQGVELRKIKIFNYHYFQAISEYKKGNIDIVYKYNKKPEWENAIDERVKEYSYTLDNQANNSYIMGFNFNSEIFGDKEMRRALRNSIDFKDVVEDVYGKGIYLFPLLPIYQNSWFRDETLIDASMIHLKDILEKKYKIIDGYFEKGGRPFTIKIAGSKNDDYFNKVIPGLEEQFKGQGIKLETYSLEDQEMFEVLNGRGSYDLFITNRLTTELPSIRDEIANKEDKTLLNTELTSEAIMMILSNKDKTDTRKNIQNLSRTWQESFIVNTPYIVMSSSNRMTIINKAITGIYINEFVGIDYEENLKNIKIRYK